MNSIRLSFWGNVKYPSNEAAKQARDEKARELKKQGYAVRRSMLTNQLCKWYSLGQRDGRSGSVYEIEYTP